MTSDDMINRVLRRMKNNSKKQVKPGHQGSKEKKRRLRQIAYDRLDAQVVTPEAKRASNKLSNWI